MLHDFRFYLALSLFFLMSFISSLIMKLLFKKNKPLMWFYALSSLFFSIGIGFNLRGSIHFSDIVNPFTGFVLFCGFLNGITSFFLPLVFIGPLVFSIMVDIPLRSFEPETHTILGMMKFYPSNKGYVTVDWVDHDMSEHIFSLEGERAAAVIRKRIVPEYLFFLKDDISIIGILSKPVSVSDLPVEDTSWYKTLMKETSSESPFYKISYPGIKYYNPGFFNSVVISVSEGQIIQERK